MTTKGAIGFISYMLVWLAMAWAMFLSIRRRSGYTQLAVLVIGAAMLGYFVQNLFLFDTPATLMHFSLLAAFAVAQEFWAGEKDTRPAHSWIPQGLKDKINLRPISAAMRTSWGASILISLVSIVVVVALYTLNLRAYDASADIASFEFSRRTGTEWEERMVFVEDSVDKFPALANYPRRIFMNESTRRLPSLSEDDFQNDLELIAKIGSDALEMEPYNWRIIGLMTLLYQLAGERDEEYVKMAREHLDLMIQISPNLPNTIALSEQQEILEQRTATP